MLWSCIASFQNIDHLSFCHASVKGDEMVIDFDFTKMKKRGEKVPQRTVINVMTVATGILPHTKIIKYLNDFSTKLHDLLSKLENIYVCLKKVVSYSIEEKMASNGNLSDDALGRRIHKFHNSWGISIDIKLSYFNSRLTSVLTIHDLPGSNVSVEAAEKNSDTAPRIEGRYYVYMYDGKLGMHVSTNFDLQ